MSSKTHMYDHNIIVITKWKPKTKILKITLRRTKVMLIGDQNDIWVQQFLLFEVWVQKSSEMEGSQIISLWGNDPMVEWGDFRELQSVS